MNVKEAETDRKRAALKRAAAEAAVALVQPGMVVGLGTGSTAAFAIEALAQRHRQGLRIVAIPTSERSAAQARAAGISLTSLTEHRRIDLTIDGADEIERGMLNLIKGLGGALLREKIVAAASDELVIIADNSKLVDRLGTQTAVPVEVIPFGIEAAEMALDALAAGVKLRATADGAPFVTDSGNHILDCTFGPIADPARLENRINSIVGVVECGLFVGRAHLAFVASEEGVHRLESSWAHRGSPPILVIMGISGAGKSTIAKALSERLGWTFQEGDEFHPEANIAKMRDGIPLTDADRQPWLVRVVAWIDRQRGSKRPGIITCSALKRSYRQLIIGGRPEARLVYLRGGRDTIAKYLAGRQGHFMPARLLESQIDTLEEPDPDEDPLVVDIGRPQGEIAEEIIRRIAVPKTLG